MIRIDVLAVGPFQSNCYIASCTETGRALVVDAGDEADRILDAVEKLGVGVDAIVCTHSHIDHVAALPEVVAALGVPVWMHRADFALYEGIAAQAAMFGLESPGRVEVDRFLEDGDVIGVGSTRAEVVAAPGHSPGSVCLGWWDESPPCVIVGDVLFRGSIGRTDLPGGSYETLMETLRRRFVPLPATTVIYPGHGPATTIGEEKRTNPFLAPLAGG